MSRCIIMLKMTLIMSERREDGANYKRVTKRSWINTKRNG